MYMGSSVAQGSNVGQIRWTISASMKVTKLHYHSAIDVQKGIPIINPGILRHTRRADQAQLLRNTTYRSTRNLAAASDTLIRRIADSLAKSQVVIVELTTTGSLVIKGHGLVGRNVVLEGLAMSCVVVVMADAAATAAAAHTAGQA